jgi:hypothetical protein
MKGPLFILDRTGRSFIEIQILSLKEKVVLNGVAE